MEFFKKFFNNMHELDSGEFQVACPFPHTDDKGNHYFETHPSAHINMDKGLFHCKVCGEGMSESSFLAKVQGISYKDASKLIREMQRNEGHKWNDERAAFLNSGPVQETWQSLGLDLNIAEQLKIGYEGKGLSFPVFVYGDLLDVRTYTPNEKPKVRSRKGAKNLLLPFDLWREDDRPTLLCAGEKDMAIARQMGFNSLTFTGGEQSFPKLFKASFKDKTFYIVYDNDQAGHEGARKIASLLKDCGAHPYVVIGHYTVCTEKGEDIHDFFCKYGGTRETLQKMLDDTPEFTEEEYRVEQSRYIPLVTIEESTKGKYSNRLVSSRVSVVATYEEVMRTPDYAELTKTTIDPNSAYQQGHTWEWSLDEENAEDVLWLVDSNLTEDKIKDNLKRLVHMPSNEKGISINQASKTNVFKAVVTDDMESEVADGDEDQRSSRELLIYSIGQPLVAGVKYRIFYKPVAHPLKGAQVVGVVTRQEDSDNSINRFEVNKKVMDSLAPFKLSPGETVSEKMNELYERAKGIIGVFARKDVTFATELFFHTPLELKFNGRKERAYLDVMIVGPERSGKSEAAKNLLHMYELGTITSLKTSTVAGLLGGSDQTSGGWKTKLGLLPKNHKGAVIMEEFSGGGQDLISKLTEVRSSNKVRLTRVNGTIAVDAMVRMLSISNVAKDSSGNTLPIRNYPNGIKVILDLVGTSEDIARYDYFLIMDEVNTEDYVSPLAKVEQEPFAKESYMNRIRWVWSRKVDQIQMSEEVMVHIWKLSQELNKAYDCHIKLFGPEAWKKLSRISVACAGMLCSMDETGENLIVTKDHVNWARNFMVSCYDNKLFKLREYVDKERRLVQCDDAAIHALQGMYNSHAVLLQQLEMSTEMSQRDMQMMSGLDQKEFTKVMNQLVQYSFITFPNAKALPTQRFRMAMNQINKGVYIPKIGEN